MTNQFQYPKMKITDIKIIVYILLFFTIQPASSLAQIIEEVVVQDTVFVKPDSISAKIPQKIISKDTTFQQYMKSSWQMSKLTMNEYFQEDLGDLLTYFPGIYLLDFGSSGQRLGFRRHGANDKQTSLFFDGRPFYDPIFGGNDLNLIPVGFTKTITIEQGLSSPYVTSNAEMVSLKSESYEEDIPFSQVSYHKANYGYSDVDIVFGQRISKKTDILLGGIIKSYNGRTQSHKFEQQNFRGKLHYRHSPYWTFVYSMIHNRLNRNVPGPILADANYSTPNAMQTITRLDQTLTIKGKIFNSDEQNFGANIYYSNLNSSFGDQVYNLQLTSPSRYAGFNFQIQNNFLGQKITAGTDFIHEWTNADIIGKHKHTIGSFFVQDDWDWQEKVGLRLLGNYKRHNIHHSHFLGGISSYFRINQKLKLTLSAKQSVRFPTFLELNGNTNYIGNPNLNSENHQKFIAGLDWKLNSTLLLKSNFYIKNVLRVIDYELLDSLTATFINRDRIKYYGLDLQIQWSCLSKFQFHTLFSAIDIAELYDQPQIMLTSYIQYTDSFFQNDLRPTLRLEGKFIGKRNSNVLHPYYYTPNFQELNPDYILNAHAILDFGSLKIFITMENILDYEYQLIYGYPMNERTLHYGLRWEFWD